MEPKKEEAVAKTAQIKDVTNEKKPDDDPESENYNKWWYIDKHDEVQGPFPESHMVEWFVAGYFPPETPLRSPALTGRKYKRLAALQKNPDFFLQDHLIKWIYLDENGEEQGPFWNDEMAEWWNDGFLPPTLKVKKLGQASFLPIIDHFNCEFMKGSTRKALPPAPVVSQPATSTNAASASNTSDSKIDDSTIKPVTVLEKTDFIPPPPKPKCLANITLTNPNAVPTASAVVKPAPVAALPLPNQSDSLAQFLQNDKTWYFLGPDGIYALM